MTRQDLSIFHISEERCRDLVAMDCIRYEESIYCRKRMSRISHICCNVSLTWLRAVKRPWSDKDVTRMMHVGRDCLFLQDHVFFLAWYLPGIGKIHCCMSLFECKRSDSVLYNVILITTGTIFLLHKMATVNTLPFNWYCEGSVLGEGMCLHCLLMLTNSTKIKKIRSIC